MPSLVADVARAFEGPFRAPFAALPGGLAPTRCFSFALFLGGPLSFSFTLRPFPGRDRRALSVGMAPSSAPVALDVRAHHRDVLVVPGLLHDLADDSSGWVGFLAIRLLIIPFILSLPSS